MRGKGFLLLLLLFFGCSKNKEGFNQVRILGHAATGLEILNAVYHDNSKEAVEFALSMEGCDGVEIDIQLSKDGSLWLYHDNELKTETNGEGCINNSSDSILQNVTYSTFTKEKLTALASLDFTKFVNKDLVLDLRHFNTCTNSTLDAQKVIDALTSLHLNGVLDFNLICLVSNDDWIGPFKTAGFTVYSAAYAYNEINQKLTSYPTLDGFVVKNSDFNSDEIKNILTANKKVYIFEVRSPKGIRSALNKLPTGILTDDLRATIIEKY